MIFSRQLIALGLLATSLSGCATILGGPITSYQRTKPLPGQPQREVRVAALVADIFLVGLLGVGVDFATGAIYRPRPTIPAPVPTAPAALAAPAVAPGGVATPGGAMVPPPAPASTPAVKE